MSLRHLVKDLKSLGIYDDIGISMDKNYEESYGYYYFKHVSDTELYRREQYKIGIYNKYYRRCINPHLILINKHSYTNVPCRLFFTFNDIGFMCDCYRTQTFIESSKKLSYHDGLKGMTGFTYPAIKVHKQDEYIRVCKEYIQEILMKHYAHVYKKTYVGKSHLKKCKGRCGEICKHLEDMKFLRGLVS